MKFQTNRFRVNIGSSPEDTVDLREEPSSRRPRTYPPPACNRCRKYKKKCSKTLPACKTCTDAGRRCSYFNFDSNRAQSTEVLQARIQWLTEYIEHNIHQRPEEGANSSASAGKEGLNVEQDGISDDSPRFWEKPSISLLPMQSLLNGPSDRNGDRRNDEKSPKTTTIHPLHNSLSPATRRTSVEDGQELPLSCINAYFDHVHRGYPFLDKQRVVQARDRYIGQNLVPEDADSMMLYLVVAIGRTTLERSGKLPRTDINEIEMPYQTFISHCIKKEDLDSVRILLLLCLYSLFDPLGIKTWTIVGILTRQALILGLPQLRIVTEKTSEALDEHSNRLFWSIFVIDRMVSISVGQAPGLAVRDLRVPLPAITVDEFASPQRVELSSMLLVSRHVIQLRRIEGEILERIHLRAPTDTASLSLPDKAAIISMLRYEVDKWYSEGCLIAQPEAGNIRIHDSLTWLNARYNQLLMMLYYPGHFNQPYQSSSNELLLDFVQKSIGYNHFLFEQHQLPLNYITLSRMVQISLSLCHCFAYTALTSFPAKGGIENCIEILSAFDSSWRQAHILAEAMHNFLLLITTFEDRFANSTEIVQVPWTLRPTVEPTLKSWLLSLREDLITISRNTLGKDNCFQFIERWDIGIANSYPPLEILN
ncbi:conserved hypothetical protein [Talaromyces stipitatus ATCC 10500]|uniref:Zn(2)-C6 fungal-type domain-containing protein n=1 Tax=Talaromyces stipitatus (strain ATCC 10500 / CBS 375.48 / QM 6759 / NRRL 1006) TaxID=441959 RepID=B8MFM5_TALSN|nr:uncharacterized protein TSTA_020720 [Talaromyces stipitatus ATCC 10500]EED17015.1 conserved hypothetical protein [Talaromyces stipitatus ATCC 10500]